MTLPFFPFLLLVWPVLTILASNIYQVPITDAARALALSALVGALLTALFWRKLAGRTASLVLNCVALVMVAIPLISIIGVGVPRDISYHKNKIPPTAAPDIYFIILDSYTRPDYLLERFHLDISDFTDGLERLGFTVSDCTLSDYPKTDAALTSILNLDRIASDEIMESEQNETSIRPLWDKIRHSAARSELAARGYKMVAFETGFIWTEITDAEQYIPVPEYPAYNEFEIFLLDLANIHPAAVQEDVTDLKRARTLNILTTLPDLASQPGAKFVFVHLITPHPPFVFGSDGQYQDWATYRNPTGSKTEYSVSNYNIGYRDQVTFINYALLPVLERIIRRSALPPVIILQGDHGPWYTYGQDPYKIFSAFYGLQAPDCMAPVNDFRLILGLPLLPNK